MLAALKDDMLQPDTIEAFVSEYVTESNRLTRECDRDGAAHRQELKGVEAGIQRLTNAILNGVDAMLVRDELNRLGRRKAGLEEMLGATTEPSVPALFHPKLAQVYRAKVRDVLAAYTNEASRAQAQDVIRRLIERIVLTPVDGVLRVEMTGDLAAMLMISPAGTRKNTPEAVASGARQIKMVAGTGFEPVTFRL